MDQKKDDDKKPAIPIPTLRDSKNAPQLKIKGLAQGGLSLMERLKQFKKKDLAFILAGLGVLFLAPLAEHFMMAPEGDQGGLQGGFGARGGEGVFGKGGSPYEPGVNGLAPGGLAGGGSDVITPLNVRDPAALVMGPGATQQPPATSAPAPAAPSKSDGNDWKDALAQSAAKAAGAAVPKAALPMSKVPLSGGGLRGLGAVSGGGGGSFSLPGISAGNVPNKGNVNSSPSPTGGGGIKQFGARGLDAGAGGGLANLKKAAQDAANVFNGPGSASSNLEQAAKTQFGDGSGGGMGEGGGANDKASGQSGDKGSKNADGQSLAFLRAKQEMEKEIEMEWKKKEAGDLDLMWYKLRDKMAEEALMTPFKAITGLIAKQITALGVGGAGTIYCQPPGAKPGTQIFPVSVTSLSTCFQAQAPNTDGSQTGQASYCGFPASNGTDVDYSRGLWSCGSGACQGTPALICGDKSDNANANNNNNPNYVNGGPAPFLMDCTNIGGQDMSKIPGNIQADFQAAVNSLKGASAGSLQAREGFGGGSPGGQCGATSLPSVTALYSNGGSVPGALSTASQGTNDRLNTAINALAGGNNGNSVSKTISGLWTTMSNEIKAGSGNAGKFNDIFYKDHSAAPNDKLTADDVAAARLVNTDVGGFDASATINGINGVITPQIATLNGVGADLQKVNTALTDINKVIDPTNGTATLALKSANDSIGRVKANEGNNPWDQGLGAWAGRVQGDLQAQQQSYTTQKALYDNQQKVFNLTCGAGGGCAAATAGGGTDTLVQRVADGVAGVNKIATTAGGANSITLTGSSLNAAATNGGATLYPYKNLATSANVIATKPPTTTLWSTLTSGQWSKDMKQDGNGGGVQRSVAVVAGIAASLNADATALTQSVPIPAPAAATGTPALGTAWSAVSQPQQAPAAR